MAATTARDRLPPSPPHAEAGSPGRSQPSDEWRADIEVLTRPLLEALANLAGLESTYLTVFDWDRREQEVRFVFSAGQIQVVEGHRIPLPAELSPEAFPGVTRSPLTTASPPDSLVARRLGLKAYVSVPVTVGKHRLFGMLCGASRNPREISESVVDLMESFARLIADHVVRARAEASENRAKLAESQLVSRTRFIAQAEHRLKTPLTALRGLSVTLRDHWDDLAASERVEFHAGIVRNAGLLSKEVDGLLAEARADMRTRELNPVRVDLGPLVRMMAKAFDGLSTSHHVMADDVSDGIGAFVDPIAIHQVLGHLLDNAVKYSPNGGRITIRVSEGADGIAIDVIDQGVGLPSAQDIFEPFRRGEGQEAGTPGIGLGLHIVRSLVEAMSGTVTARSNPGGGSTFTAIVPPAPRF